MNLILTMHAILIQALLLLIPITTIASFTTNNLRLQAGRNDNNNKKESRVSFLPQAQPLRRSSSIGTSSNNNNKNRNDIRILLKERELEEEEQLQYMASFFNNKSKHMDIKAKIIWNPNNINNNNNNNNNNSPYKRCIMFIDNFSEYHSGYLIQQIFNTYNDVCILQVVSPYVAGYLYRQEEYDESSSNRIIMPSLKEDMQRIVATLRQECQISSIEAIYCESDSGLFAAEYLAAHLGIVKKHNGINSARRDKYLLNELVHSCTDAGLTTGKQQLCLDWEDASAFARDELLLPEEREESLLNEVHDDNAVEDEIIPTMDHDDDEYNTGVISSSSDKDEKLVLKKCIAKPCRGVGSDNVFQCHTIKQLKQAFHTIQSSTPFGSITTTATTPTANPVLVQEFAYGAEYALDVVSNNGKHKMAALWKYDKRAANDAPFVYFATELIDGTSTVGESIYNFTIQVLDSLDIKWGLCHVEVMLQQRPQHPLSIRLIEVNCRQHNTDFIDLSNACIGYNAFDILLSSYLDEDQDNSINNWKLYPNTPTTRAYGAIVHLVSYVEGTLISLHQDVDLIISNLSSVRYMDIYPQYCSIGGDIQKTIDITTDAGVYTFGEW